MDTVVLTVSSLVHQAETFTFPVVRSKSLAVTVAVGIPVAVLLHDTADRWLPKTWEIPIISWFRRKWRQDPETKVVHLALARNAVLFFFVAMALSESPYYQTPVDYVSDRVSSSSARKALDGEIRTSRRVGIWSRQRRRGRRRTQRGGRPPAAGHGAPSSFCT
ncbi:Present in the outer mitochondrial membrane proteome 6 [Trypanosoma cruzi]|uniref:Present in the outer mitochondrial membrane proteome 6 n=1 Tax=Trypanosoma cruzi TaxID=5693 RepID=A0A2V2UFV7_TRYCR|nr:Present in the outer mitochondrial membrane proteome 6 [Trypanosoma cruzi]